MPETCHIEVGTLYKDPLAIDYFSKELRARCWSVPGSVSLNKPVGIDKRNIYDINYCAVYCICIGISNFKPIKVVRVVKFTFMEWFFYNFVILIKLYKIWYLNLGKALLFPRNKTICLKNWKLWRAPTAIKFNIFAEIVHKFPT